jgi:hypothetical protein
MHDREPLCPSKFHCPVKKAPAEEGRGGRGRGRRDEGRGGGRVGRSGPARGRIPTQDAVEDENFASHGGERDSGDGGRGGRAGRGSGRGGRREFDRHDTRDGTGRGCAQKQNISLT